MNVSFRITKLLGSVISYNHYNQTHVKDREKNRRIKTGIEENGQTLRNKCHQSNR